MLTDGSSFHLCSALVRTFGLKCLGCVPLTSAVVIVAVRQDNSNEMVSYSYHSHISAAESIKIARTNSLDNNIFSLLFAVFSLKMTISPPARTDALLAHLSLGVNIPSGRWRLF